MPHPGHNSRIRKPELWLRAVVLIALLGFALYGASRQQPVSHQARPSTVPSSEDSAVETWLTATRTRIARQTIRDQNGKVIFRGDVDVCETLDRIRRHEQLDFSHDGTVFQNRERRL